MKNTIAYVKSGLPGSMTFEEYFALTTELVHAGKTTGENQSEEFVKYTHLNRHRMNRLNKTTVISDDVQRAVKAINQKTTWLVLSEAWCGDAAQNLPVIHHIAQLNPLIELKIILRDEHLDIMDELLTNGGRSIPKLVAFDENFNELYTWGPRPAEVQKMVNAYKALPEPKKPYSEFVEEVQKWYVTDGTQSLQSEFLQLLK